jgi:hypothetical protein
VEIVSAEEEMSSTVFSEKEIQNSSFLFLPETEILYEKVLFSYYAHVEKISEMVLSNSFKDISFISITLFAEKIQKTENH